MNTRVSALVGLMLGCTSTRAVGPDTVRAVGSKRTEAVAVDARATAFNARLGPQSTLRVFLKGGEKTDAFSAWGVRVSDTGLFAPSTRDLATITDARVRGLDAWHLQRLILVAPQDSEVTVDGDAVVLYAKFGLALWLRQFADKVALPAYQCAKPPCSVRHQLQGRWVGDWQFMIDDRLIDADLAWSLDLGVEWLAGWRWSEIEHIEVEFISGPKSLAGMIGTAALAVVLAPVAFAGLGGGRMGSKGSKGSSGSSGAAKSFSSSGSISLGGSSMSAEGDPGTHTALIGRRDATEPLFTTKAQVGSIIRGVATVDANATGIGAQSRQGGSAVLSMRLAETVELGGGVGVGRNVPFSGFFRGAILFPMDAVRDYTVVLSGDIGGHERGKFGRLGAGLRIRSGPWFAEVVNVSASYVGGDVSERGWRLSVGSALGVTIP